MIILSGSAQPRTPPSDGTSRKARRGRSLSPHILRDSRGSIGSRSRPSCSVAPNQKSVREMPHIAERKISKERLLGRVAGPFTEPPLPGLIVSPLGIVPKKVPGEFRLIHNLSYPKGGSVNDAIPREQCSVHYASLDHAIKLVRECGPGALMAKCDIESAFRLLPVHPHDFRFLGFKFQDNWYFDKAMPMGCSIACAAFETFSTFVEWAMKQRSGSHYISHYLDDYFLVRPAGSDACARALACFEQLAAEFGIPLAADKTEGPTTVISYLGIELDSISQTSRLPQAKLQILREMISGMLLKEKTTVREVQVLLGHLNFACRVIAPGRAFCARLNRLLAGGRARHHHIRLTKVIKENLNTWLAFLKSYNGVSFWQSWLQPKEEFQIHSDASGRCGFGVYFRGHWCAQPWPASWHAAGVTRDLTFLEFFPILVALRIWGSHLKDTRVCFWSDNQAVVRIIAKQSAKSDRVIRILHLFVLECLGGNISFSARFIPGLNNEIADALSRFQMERFRELAPEADQLPETFPEELWKVGEPK
nr:uncharacterized protein LOC118085646 [Zootoca vivipara]